MWGVPHMTGTGNRVNKSTERGSTGGRYPKSEGCTAALVTNSLHNDTTLRIYSVKNETVRILSKINLIFISCQLYIVHFCVHKQDAILHKYLPVGMNRNQQKYGRIEVQINIPTHSQYNIVDSQIQ